MPNFDISINVYLLLVSFVITFLAGFTLRKKQIGKKNRVIAELERDMMQAYAELLDTQKDFCELEGRIKESPSPVISIKNKAESPDFPKQEVTVTKGVRKGRSDRTA